MKRSIGEIDDDTAIEENENKFKKLENNDDDDPCSSVVVVTVEDIIQQCKEEGMNDSDVTAFIGQCFAQGMEGLEKDYSKAMEWCMKVRENPLAQHEIGLMYQSGYGVLQDYSKAMEWFLKSAEQGYLTSNYYIGLLYLNGEGVEKDEFKAFEWFLKAAENGEEESQFKVGIMYKNGEGVEKDNTKAITWLNRAANNDHYMAPYEIGLMYLDGTVPKNQFILQLWILEEAVERGVPIPLYEIGNMYYHKKDIEKAMKCFEKGAEKGEHESQYMAGKFYLNGFGVEKDETKAMEWFLKSAENDNTKAKIAIGAMYNKGFKGNPKNISKALEWFFKVYNNDNNNIMALLNIGALYLAEKKYTQALEWYLKAALLNNKEAQKKVAEIYSITNNTVLKLYWLYKVNNRGIEYSFIQDPFNKFGISPLLPYNNGEHNVQSGMNDEKNEKNENCVNVTDNIIIIIRFEERDVTVNSQSLKKSIYFSTMMNEKWNKHNYEQDDTNLIINLKSIQNEIIMTDEQRKLINPINLFELYFEYLNNTSSIPTDNETKIQLYELAKYLNDENLILNLIQNMDIILRWYLKIKFGEIDQTDYAIINFYIMLSKDKILNIPHFISKLILENQFISPLVKLQYVNRTDYESNNIPNELSYHPTNVYHVCFSKSGDKRAVAAVPYGLRVLIFELYVNCSYESNYWSLSCPQKNILPKTASLYIFFEGNDNNNDCLFYSNNIHHTIDKTLFQSTEYLWDDLKSMHLVLFL